MAGPCTLSDGHPRDWAQRRSSPRLREADRLHDGRGVHRPWARVSREGPEPLHREAVRTRVVGAGAAWPAQFLSCSRTGSTCTFRPDTWLEPCTGSFLRTYTRRQSNHQRRRRRRRSSLPCRSCSGRFQVGSCCSRRNIRRREAGRRRTCRSCTSGRFGRQVHRCRCTGPRCSRPLVAGTTRTSVRPSRTSQQLRGRTYRQGCSSCPGRTPGRIRTPRSRTAGLRHTLPTDHTGRHRPSCSCSLRTGRTSDRRRP